MKKAIYLLFVMVFVVSVSTAQNNTVQKSKGVQVEMIKKEGGAVLELESDTVDYGTIKQHSDPLRTLKIRNTGDEPLVIKSARGSCGCTVPKYAKEPIMPGESSVLEIRYATNRVGKINKIVTLTTNDVKGKHIIKVIGNVEKAEKKASLPTKAKGMLKSGL